MREQKTLLTDLTMVIKNKKSEQKKILLTFSFLPFFFSIAFCIKSCNTNSDDTSLKGILVNEKTIIIKIDSNTNYINNYIFYFVDKKSNERFITTYEEESNTINFYNLTNNAHSFKINLNKNQYLSPIYGYYIQNFDSIFLLKTRKNVISLIDTSLKVKKKWEITDSIYNTKEYELNATKVNNIIYSNGKIYVTNNKFSDVDNFFDSHSEIILDLSSEKPIINNNTGAYPEVYLKHNYYHLVGTMVSKIIKDDCKIVFSFPVDHNIYIYNSEGIIDKKMCKSIYIDSFPIFDQSKFSDNYYTSKYTCQLPTYFSIKYDSYRKLYYRIVLHSLKYKNEDGTLNKFISKKWSIIILNKDFKILNEIIMPENKYNFADFLITPEGILISNNNPMNPSLDENKLTFTFFKVQ